MNAIKSVTIGLFLILLSGCATTTKEKIVRNTIFASVIGGSIGAAKQEHKTANTIMYGASAGLVTALASLFYYDPDKELESLRKTTSKLRDEMEEFDNGIKSRRSGFTTNYGPALNSLEKLPEEYRRMINPGQWSVSEIDQWVDGGEGRLIHQDKMLELKPATLKSK